MDDACCVNLVTCGNFQLFFVVFSCWKLLVALAVSCCSALEGLAGGFEGCHFPVFDVEA